jgi:hypothetical protein
MAEQELLTAERHAALPGALARLPPRCQQLIGMLIEDPPVPDAQISAALSIPVGSIAPRPFSRPGQAARRRTSQTVAAMSSTDSASSQPPSIHWNGQNRLAGW